MAADNDLLVDVDTVAAMLTGDGPPDGDGIRFLLDALASATDDALALLSGRIECHTARGGVVEPQLAALRSQARSREEKAAVALVTARAAEGSGDYATARDLLDEALTLRPGLEPALHDAAEYAATRGDYATADRYLRRAERPSSLRAGLSEAITATTIDAGRNSPCPCGSGRKFKVCCRRDAVPTLGARAQLVYALLGTYTERAPGVEMITPWLDRTDDVAQHAMFFLDLALFRGGLVERFLATRGHWLRPEERELIEAWRRIPVTVYETVDVSPGTSVTLRALPDGDPIHLTDKLFSECALRLELFCGRVLHDDVEPRLLALPVHVARHRRRELVSLLASDPSIEQLADFFAPEPPIQLRNSDGDHLHECSVTYQVPDAQRTFDHLVARLTQTDDDLVARHRDLPDGRVLGLGQIERDGDDFTVTANSPSRLADLEAHLLDVAPDAVERDRRIERISPEPDGREARTMILDSYLLDADSAADQIGRDVEAIWLDTPGVIGNLSPRDAAISSDRAIRTELHSTIDDVEANLLQAQRAGQPTACLMNPHRLRDALALEHHAQPTWPER
ncbi:MAG TPA: SEC-C metal-binding domain-containing protein [Pseudonocardiaceae bacterium]|nr:SEC-C metal-binding domain-containing protein [Pseudonocardiaceae bacterium]